MAQPKISVIIGTYNQKSVLERVLASFNMQSLDPSEYEVIVVDSMSTDGTDALLKSHRPQHGFLYYIQENTGKTGARNRAIEAASAPIILVTDSDMIADTKLVETHLRAHQAQQTPACFEGLTYNMHRLHWPPQSDLIFPYITRPYNSGKKLGWYYFLTGNVSFSKALYVEMGGFDLDFKGYGWEDLELGYRISRQKVPLYYLKDAINYHYHVITKDEEISRNYDKGKSARIFLKKHPSLKWFLGLNPVSVWTFKRLSRSGAIYQMMDQKWRQSPTQWKSGIARWFLGEFEYLSGILSDDKL